MCFANPGATEQPFVDAAAAAGFTVAKIYWSRAKPIFKAARAVAAYLRRGNCNIIHCHNTYANMVGLLASRMYRVKTITTLYVWGKFGFKREVLQWIDAVLMKGFDRVSAHCESCFWETVARGMPATELELLVCGYPSHPARMTTAERDAHRKEMGVQDGESVLIFMARFWPEKAHDNLLAGFRLLLERHPRTRLWLPGIGPELDRIRGLCTEIGLKDVVDFLGFRGDADNLLALADIQVHPSDNEGVPLAICAGMSAALPIVASRVGGLPEVLKDGENSVLIPPRNPAAFADAVSRLLNNPDEARQLGDAARRFIEQKYSLEAAAAKVQSVYSALLDQ
jgi:glycosyltransferase involved in cell wall biosynthesis